MPAASDVHPRKWGNDLTVLFDNGWYSVVSGTYEQDDGTHTHSLGERWNGSPGDVGFPRQGRYPTFYVVPDFLAAPVLRGLLDELDRQPAVAGRDEYIRQINRELQRQHAGLATTA